MKLIANLLLLPLIAAAVFGCPAGNGPPSVPAPLKDGKEMTPVTGRSKPSDDRYVLIVRIRMATIEVPVGTASESEEIWSYLDEEPIAAMRSASLGRNGFRIGIGRKDAWDDVVRTLKRMTGRKLKENTMLAIPGDPLPIVLKKRQPTQTIFTFHDDLTLSGADYPPGEYIISLVCTLDEEDPSTVLITGAPQIRSLYRKPKIKREGGSFKLQSKPVLYSLDSVVFQAPVPAGDFLVIGPGAESRRPHSIGHHFLVKKKEGMEFETVLVLIPEVFAAPLK